MKNAFLILVLSLVAGRSLGQSSEKFVKAMQPQVAAFDTTRSTEGLQALSNTFERIADAEKKEWLPYYYAALCNINIAFNHAMAAGPLGGNADKVDPLADKAEKFLGKAEELSKDNSEIYVAKKQLATVRMMGDVMSRYMEYGPIGTEALAKAKKLNPENPRVYVLEGTDLFNTPEQYGGSKEEAKKVLEVALAKFDSFKPESSIHPNWGASQARYFISMIK